MSQSSSGGVQGSSSEKSTKQEKDKNGTTDLAQAKKDAQANSQAKSKNESATANGDKAKNDSSNEPSNSQGSGAQQGAQASGGSPSSKESQGSGNQAGSKSSQGSPSGKTGGKSNPSGGTPSQGQGGQQGGKQGSQEAGGQPSSGQSPSGGKPGESGSDQQGGQGGSGPKGQGGQGGGNRQAGGGAPSGPGGSTGGEKAADDSQASPRAETKQQGVEDTVAPNDQPQTDLTLRRYRDLLDKDQVTPELLNVIGMSKEELNQFVKKYEQKAKTDPIPGREVEVKPGKTPGLDPNIKLPGIDPGISSSTQVVRDRGGIARDTTRNVVEAQRFAPPQELRAGFDAYRNSLSRSKVVSPSRRGASPKSGTK